MFANAADDNFPATSTTPSQQVQAAGLAGQAFLVVKALGNDPDVYSPAEGDWYAIEADAVNGWAGHDGALACWVSGAWTFVAQGGGLIIYPENAGNQYYVSSGAGTWTPWLPSGVYPANLVLNGATGGSHYPAPVDHAHPTYATAAGDAFGDPTLAWQFRLGAITGNVVKLNSGGTVTLGLGVNGDVTTSIWVLLTAGNGTLNLPAATETRMIWCPLVITGANTLTLVRAGTDTINGAGANLVLGIAANSTGRWLSCDGAGAWSFIG